MALTLTEDIVRNRVNLTHDNLEDVKSLSLPGTYHEKIVTLGNGLRKFTRLKSLDLSRNALETVEGIENLELLEKLNLYYNNISSLEELRRLKHTSNLKELDLRLNPVTRSEPDYRLFLIHLLPSLQKLDDRGVRDRERQAALMHFSSSQATEMTYHPPRKEQPPKSVHPRVELTAKLGKHSVLDSDDVAVIDLVAMKDGDFSRPRPLTGSVAKTPAVEEYSLEMLKSLSSEGVKVTTNGVLGLPPPGKKRSASLPPPKDEDSVLAAYKEKYPNIASLATAESFHKKRDDPNLQFQDEIDAYSKYKGHGFFTPHPKKGDEGSAPTDLVQGDQDQNKVHDHHLKQEKKHLEDGGDAAHLNRHRRTHSMPNTKSFPTERALPEPSQSYHQSLHPTTYHYDAGLIQARMDNNPSAKQMLFRILDLVDRYWNGSKSLHQHSRFLALALDVVENFTKEGPLAGMQHDVRSLKQRVQKLQEENMALKEGQGPPPEADATSASEAHLKLTLKQARSDVDRLREELQHYVKENARLQRRLEQQQSAASCSVSGAASSSNPLHLDSFQRQNEALSQEVEGLRGRLKQYAQKQELTSMLQESHKSLVQTNDHLLTEIDEERKRHRHEVEQMHWSYDQLKKTISYLPSTIKGDSTLNLNTQNSTAASVRFKDTDR